jgi:protein-L-isoaspartate(D-aspartate) O-methyltransferase
MRPRTRRDGRYYSSICAVRSRCIRTAGHIGARPAGNGTNGTPSVHMDAPVPIGHGQTMSQPVIVALMTHLAALKFNDTVLEVGTGSGYQAAVLARLVRKVCTVEIIPPLAEAAGKVLEALGYDNVSVRVGDRYLGWPECGPFDAMIVTAALDHVPPPLSEQLKVGGQLIMPLGSIHAPQQLTVIEKIAPSETRTRSIMLVGFVPFTRSRD